MADEELMSQDQIEQLLNQAKASPAGGSAAAPAAQSEPAAALNQDAINELLKSGSKAAPVAAAVPPPAPAAPAATPSSLMPGEGTIQPTDMEFLLNQAEQALASIDQTVGAPPTGVAQFQLPDLAAGGAAPEAASIDLIRDVELDLRIELGRTNMYLEDVLRLRKGSVVPLDKLAGDPVDVYVNGRLIARGEVLVLNDNFCVRVAELVAGNHAA
jgi:flagellar motor switch protein FliN/FliY